MSSLKISNKNGYKKCGYNVPNDVYLWMYAQVIVPIYGQLCKKEKWEWEFAQTQYTHWLYID